MGGNCARNCCLVSRRSGPLLGSHATLGSTLDLTLVDNWEMGSALEDGRALQGPFWRVLLALQFRVHGSIWWQPAWGRQSTSVPAGARRPIYGWVGVLDD